MIFSPKLTTPIKTLDLPLGGKNHASSSLSMIFELIKILGVDSEKDDEDGRSTVQELSRVRKIIERVNSKKPFSLGLHPAVYIYSKSGNFRVSCFHATIMFAKRLEESNRLNLFTKHRDKLEEIVLLSDGVIQQIVRKARHATSAIEPLVNYFNSILLHLESGCETSKVLYNIAKTDEFSYLKLDESGYSVTATSSFSKAIKNSAFIANGIRTVQRCEICGARLHSSSISYDHRVRKQDGGSGTLDNIQLSHPYCNTTFKN